MLNPLLDNTLLESNEFPPFSTIKPVHIEPAIKQLTEHNLSALKQQLSQMDTELSWATLVAPIERREDRLSRAWSTVSHLNHVANTDDVREAYQKASALLTDYSTAISQDTVLCNAYKKLASSKAYDTLTTSQKKVIENALRDFRLAGVDLGETKKARFGEIQQRLSVLSNEFSNNVLDATQGWHKQITEREQLEGLPDSVIEAAAAAAKEKGLDGWVLSLDGPIYVTVMSQAASQELRKDMYSAYTTRASEQGPCAGRWDNTHIIKEIMMLRQEKAKLLGFKHYAELSVVPKMAESPEEVLHFLTDLAQKARPQALREWEELKAYAKKEHGQAQLDAWDIPYFSERLKEAHYAVSQEAIRPYFPLSKVLDGLFSVAEKLFQVSIQEVDHFDCWHDDVRVFVIQRNQKPLAYFYLDAFARPGKRGGAWKATCRDRRDDDGQVYLPVAYLVCNFNAPVGGKPSLLTHTEVTTLFHEFGHGLHHMLTKIGVAPVSGINGVEWDAVELPSQFLENWCWQPDVLRSISGHHQTGEVLPDEFIHKLLDARNFQSGLFMLRQLEFGLFDFRLHMEFGGDGFVGVQALLDEVREKVAVILPSESVRFQHSFSHIFAGGYSAGYYSYMWALVLSADAFAAFEETNIFDQETGARFLHEILERGGSEPAMALFKRFRGRAPDIMPLLQQLGLS